MATSAQIFENSPWFVTWWTLEGQLRELRVSGKSKGCKKLLILATDQSVRFWYDLKKVFLLL